MGQDKGLMPLLGQPLIARVIAQVSGLADEVFITTNHLEGYRTLGVLLYPDVLPDRGALGGLYTALSAARHPLVAVVACDMPFANATILAAARDRLLESGADVAIPKTEAGYEPFHAIYRRETCLPAVKAALDSEEQRLISWFPAVRVIAILPGELACLDPHGLAFWNVNTPEDFQQAEGILKTGLSP